MFLKPFAPLLGLVVVTQAVTPSRAAPRDGRLFDPGVRMAARAPGAPEQLDRVAFLVGSWDVVELRTPSDGAETRSRGQAVITWMNRGHGLMERAWTEEAGGGSERSRLAFLTFVPSADAWNLGEASSLEEQVVLFHGRFEGETLSLRDAGRPGGGQDVVVVRRTLRREGAGFEVGEERSTDFGASWSPAWRRVYTPRSGATARLAVGAGLGEAAPGLPDAAHEFDFLLGEYDAAHELTLPSGQNLKYPAVATAVRVMNGHAILEFNRVDVDPQLPDAATSILRIYNRAMRRWESLFVSNRGNAQLRFGGVREGDRMVLTLFGAHRGLARFSYFVFHDIRSDGYRWYSDVSSDQGQTFRRTWTIDMTARTDDGAAGASGERP